MSQPTKTIRASRPSFPKWQFSFHKWGDPLHPKVYRGAEPRCPQKGALHLANPQMSLHFHFHGICCNCRGTLGCLNLLTDKFQTPGVQQFGATGSWGFNKYRSRRIRWKEDKQRDAVIVVVFKDLYCRTLNNYQRYSLTILMELEYKALQKHINPALLSCLSMDSACPLVGLLMLGRTM